MGIIKTSDKVALASSLGDLIKVTAFEEYDYLVDDNKVVTLENLKYFPEAWIPDALDWLKSEKTLYQVRGDATHVFAKHIKFVKGRYLEIYTASAPDAARKFVKMINKSHPDEAALKDDVVIINNITGTPTGVFLDANYHYIEPWIGTFPPILGSHLYRTGVETTGPTTISFSYNLAIRADQLGAALFRQPEEWDTSGRYLLYDVMGGIKEVRARLDGRKSAERLAAIEECIGNTSFRIPSEHADADQ